MGSSGLLTPGASKPIRLFSAHTTPLLPPRQAGTPKQLSSPASTGRSASGAGQLSCKFKRKRQPNGASDFLLGGWGGCCTKSRRGRAGSCCCLDRPGPPRPAAPESPTCTLSGPRPAPEDAQLLRQLEDEEFGELRGTPEGFGRQRDAAQDRRGRRLQAGCGDQAGRGVLLHQDLNDGAHHRDPLQDRRGVRGADGGREALQELGQVGERHQDGLRAEAAERRRAQDRLVQGNDQRWGADSDHDGR